MTGAPPGAGMLIQSSARKSWQPQWLADGACPWIQGSAWKSWQPQWLADGACPWIQGSAWKSWQPQWLADGACLWIQGSAWKSWQPQWLADGACLEAAHAVPEPLEVRRYDMPQLTGSFDLDDQFMLGPSILVAPVMQEAAVARTAFLPPSQRW